MSRLALHEFHEGMGARFTAVNGQEVVGDYGDARAEHAALNSAVGVADLSFRSRLCLTGPDRGKFLHGQVTNAVQSLRVGEGCYAALVTAKGRMQSDLNIFQLADELLLDFEPGWGGGVAARLEKFIIAEDVQVADVAPHYGVLGAHGPRAGEVVQALGLGWELPAAPLGFVTVSDATLGQIYLMNQPRLGMPGGELFVPVGALGAVWDKLVAAAKQIGGGPCGWEAMEVARVEAGIPRFGQDMDESNLPLEAGLEGRAISYTKGCYIGQEVIARIRTYGQVAKSLRGLWLEEGTGPLPVKGDKLSCDGRAAGTVTSAVRSWRFSHDIALGYVRREVNAPGREVVVATAAGARAARVVELPFRA